MSYPVMKAQCNCKACVLARRVFLLTVFLPVLFGVWVVGGLIYGLASALYYGEISLYTVAREYWTSAAKTERRVA